MHLQNGQTITIPKDQVEYNRPAPRLTHGTTEQIFCNISPVERHVHNIADRATEPRVVLHP